jgi:hypothetical protein
MTEPFKVDDLSPAARSLALGANGFQELAGSAPAIPNAGPSTAFVADVLIALAEAMEKAAGVEAGAADEVIAADARYKEADQQHQAALNKTAENVPADGGGR